MGLLDFFQKKTAGTAGQQPIYLDENQLVVIQFFYGIEDLDELHQLEKQLHSIISGGALGKYEGHEISMDFGDGYLYFNGKNAEHLFQSIKPVLEEHYFMDKSIATLRSGSFENPAAEEKDFTIRFRKLSEN